MSAQRRRIDLKRMFLWISAVLVFFIIIWLLLLLVLKLTLGTNFDAIILGSVKYTVSTPDDKGVYRSSAQRVPASDVIRYDTVYFNFTEVAKKCDARVSGDSDRVRYIFEKGEATFFFDSTLAIVGDESIILAMPCYTVDGDLFVPASFADYMYGLTVEYKNRSLTVKFDKKDVRPTNARTVEPPTPVTDKGY